MKENENFNNYSIFRTPVTKFLKESKPFNSVVYQVLLCN